MVFKLISNNTLFRHVAEGNMGLSPPSNKKNWREVELGEGKREGAGGKGEKSGGRGPR